MSHNNSIISEKYNYWNNKKQEIHFSDLKDFYVNPREVWYVHIWINIWFETLWKWKDFKRPVLVIKKIWGMFLCVSMSTKWKDSKFYYELSENYFQKKSYVVLSQWKCIDKKRFIDHIGTVSEEDFEAIKKELKSLWF